jgi:hypothetical protein
MEPYLTSPDTTLRATATAALKFMVGSAADAAVTRAFGDREIEVRRAAVHTVPFRAVTPVLPALGNLLRAEPEEAIRLAIVNALNMRMREEPAARELITWAAESDPAEKVRKLAQQVLAQPS